MRRTRPGRQRRHRPSSRCPRCAPQGTRGHRARRRCRRCQPLLLRHLVRGRGCQPALAGVQSGPSATRTARSSPSSATGWSSPESVFGGAKSESDPHIEEIISTVERVQVPTASAARRTLPDGALLGGGTTPTTRAPPAGPSAGAGTVARPVSLRLPARGLRPGSGATGWPATIALPRRRPRPPGRGRGPAVPSRHRRLRAVWLEPAPAQPQHRPAGDGPPARQPQLVASFAL